jgi:hypothetical protein
VEFSGSVKEFAAKEKLEIVKVQDFGSEFLVRPSPPQAAKCIRTILRIVHQIFKGLQTEPFSNRYLLITNL